MITNKGKYRIYNVCVKTKYYDELDLENLSLGLYHLVEILTENKVNKVRISRTGDEKSDLPKGKLI